MGITKGFSLTQSAEFLEMFGGTGGALDFLTDIGAESLEFRAITPSLEGERELMRECQKRGFGITLHPVWEGPFDLTQFETEGRNGVRRNLEMLFSQAGDIADRQAAPVVVVVHGPTYPKEEERYYDLGMKTMVSVLHWAGLHSEEKGYRLVFGFENRPKIPGRAKMGESHANTLEIVEQADHRLVGITWDMGHSLRNVELGVDELHPPQEFVERVAHVHIHDLKDGLDHYPLLYGVVPWEEYIRRLAGSGYGGVLDLEVPLLSRLGLCGSSVADDLRTSMNRISAVL